MQVEGNQTDDPFPPLTPVSFPEKLLHSVDCAGEFEEALFQLDLILATPRHSHSPHHQTVASWSYFECGPWARRLGLPAPKYPWPRLLATFPCGDAAGPQTGFSTGGLDPLTCPPAAARRGQAAFGTRSQKTAPAQPPTTQRSATTFALRGKKAHAQLHAHPSPLFPGFA